jgi:ribosomal protein S14
VNACSAHLSIFFDGYYIIDKKFMYLLKKTKIYFPNNKVLKDYKKRLIFQKYEVKKKLLNALIHDSSIAGSLKHFCVKKLNTISRNASKTRIRNRCILSGRGRAVFNKFKISRLKFREMASFGKLLGIYKKTW